ncbi:GNAT family N-acetyltransferase [Paracoccus ravus]|uniref:GNAT family N-acetyltransferase n=1 Tax=Paracoccus ravus TaxID=2447760 RepID=UPI00106E3374|nr:GNAT family protein [Paracoccus ravus]
MTDRPLGATVPDFMPPPLPGPVLHGRFVELQPLDPARHAEDLYLANRGHDALWDYMPYGPFPDAAAYLSWQKSVAGKPDPFFYAICAVGTAKVQGIASFLRIDRANGVIEIGHIQIAPAFQRSPGSSEALMLMIGWAFEQGYRRVEWKCNALNEASIRAAGRYGFSPEGTFRQHMIVKGRNRDSAWFSILDKDWPLLRPVYAAWLAPGNFRSDGSQISRLSELTREALQARGAADSRS